MVNMRLEKSLLVALCLHALPSGFLKVYHSPLCWLLQWQGSREKSCAPSTQLRLVGALWVHGSWVDTHNSVRWAPGEELRGAVQAVVSLHSFPWLFSGPGVDSASFVSCQWFSPLSPSLSCLLCWSSPPPTKSKGLLLTQACCCMPGSTGTRCELTECVFE